MSAPAPYSPETLPSSMRERENLHTAQARATAAEENLRLLVNSVTDYGIFMLDPAGIIQSWNPGAQRLKGYTASEIIGQHFSIFYSAEDQARKHPQQELDSAARDGHYEEENWRIRKDGSRFWASITLNRLTDCHGALLGFSKVTRDLSEQKLAEDLLKKSNETLERRVAERTADLRISNETLNREIHERKRVEEDLRQAIRTRDEFLSIASHELRTPLTPIKLHIQGILVQLRKNTLASTPPEKLERIAGTIDRSLNRLGKLIDNLLDVTRINAGKIELHPEALEIGEVTQDLFFHFQQEARLVGIELRLDIAPSITGYLDRIRIEQILTNLTSNAIKYGNRKPIDVIIAQRDNRLVIQIIDRGIGIALEDQARIFDRFEQVSKQAGYGGLGLGLYITKQIIDAQGGTIRIESKPDAGTRFTVVLPLNLPQLG